MPDYTEIQWTDGTVNPTMGCDGCELWNAETKTCYSGILTERHGGHNPGYPENFEDVTLYPGRMIEAAQLPDLRGTKRFTKPWLNGYPRTIFVSDMSDALSQAASFEYLANEILWNVSSAAGQRHVWQWLTKRPTRMAEFSRWLEDRGIELPSNLWAGTSVTTKGTTNRIRSLLEVGNEETKRFLSVEPQFEAISLKEWLPRLDWVIQGGASGSKPKPFDLSWARQMRDECAEAGVPYFLKQLGENPWEGGRKLKFLHAHAGDWSEWPEDLRVREFPVLTRQTATAATA